MKMTVAGYTARVWIDPEHRELVGAVHLPRKRGAFTFRASSFAQLDRECRRSARILEQGRKRAARRWGTV